MKAAIYTRVSTEEQGREGVSLSNQVAKCRLQAQLGDWAVQKEVEDAGRSGKSLNRPGIQDLLRMVRCKEVQGVIIYKLDRLTRNVSDLNRLIELFTRHGVSLVSVSDALDTRSASGRMTINILGSISQWEREAIAERTSEALQHMKATSRKYTRITPYGFRLEGGQYLADEVEQSVLDEISRLRDDLGYSFQEVAAHLNQKEVPTRLGKPWAKQTIQKLYQAKNTTHVQSLTPG